MPKVSDVYSKIRYKLGIDAEGIECLVKQNSFNLMHVALTILAL